MVWEMVSASLFLDCDEGEVVLRGQVFGAAKSVAGEIVFQTGMVGYVESLSDPSYAKQLLVLTFPLIGNYGVPNPSVRDEFGFPKGFESDQVWPTALIVDRICADGEHSHWEATSSLSEYLRRAGVPGLCGIDTRYLTKIIREKGVLRAKVILDTDDATTVPYVDINKQNLVRCVSSPAVKKYGSGTLRILAVDCGLKYNQIRCLLKRGAAVEVVPWNYPFHEKCNDYDGLFLSNGPGDPAMCTEVIDHLSALLKRDFSLRPVFGVCLGHQLLARAAGATTSKLKFGNRGHNQPCTHEDSGRCFITSQNHGYAVDVESLPAGWKQLFVNENDATNEGIVHMQLPYFSVQFHPEHCAGPEDLEFLFDIFMDAAKNVKAGKPFCVREAINSRLFYESTYCVHSKKKVLVLGSGGLSIGQAGEFDYSGAQALKALKEQSIRTVLINPNVATVQTSKGFADQTYFLPITKEYVTDVIKKERPTGILCTFGGQTALNCAIDLHKAGVLEQFHVEVLGTSIETLRNTEDRERFNAEMEKINEKVAPSRAATSIADAVKAGEELGFPVLVRAAYALGGLGSGFANNASELSEIAQRALAHSTQVLIDKSLKGWKEVEYEVVRDAYDNCITVCNMENVDPLGIHTGESVVVAPSQTLCDHEYQRLRTAAIKIIRHLCVIGECNIQFAVNPARFEYFIIEVNARLSRSSALASKATGYPLAYVAARIALGERLPKIKNSVTEVTTACFEPSLDYCVVKVPRWDLSKFARVSAKIGSSMKSVGEAMGIGRCFEEAFQKALRMVNDSVTGFSPSVFPREPTDDDFLCPTDKRMFALARGLHSGAYDVETLHKLTNIDRWFLYRMQNIIDIHHRLRTLSVESESLSNLSFPEELMREAKQTGFSDKQIARVIESEEKMIREARKGLKIEPCVKQIDTVSAEWPAKTNYLYLTYNGQSNDVAFDVKNSVVVLGSGVYRIGSSVEFDACCVGCIEELKRLDYRPITINCNPETVSTDYDMCERLYFEEISREVVVDICEKERPKGVILAFGGQAPNNIATSLLRTSCCKLKVFGTSPEHIDKAEDRYTFSRLLDALEISQPRWQETFNVDDTEKFCERVGYPCLIRPSYVLSGAAMNVAHNSNDLRTFLQRAAVVARDRSVVVTKFISGAKEIDVDAVAFEGKVLAIAVSEHVENAGIHSGDATLVTPPQDINSVTLQKIRDITYRIAKTLKVNGPFNIQLIAKDDELMVIECNLRASRSLPFVSKALDFDFVALATRCMVASDDTELRKSLVPDDRVLFGKERVGVKVPQFSFSRLAGADVMLGVEMSSTGEVACFGKDRYEAYLKALLSTGFVCPEKTIFLSIGGYSLKEQMLDSVRTLHDLKYELLASKGTAEYFCLKNIPIKSVEWPFEEGSSDVNEKTAASSESLAEAFRKKGIHLMINLPIRGSGAYRVSTFRTLGYKTRRMAIDNGIPLITDIKCAKLFIEALRLIGPHPKMNSQIDSISCCSLVRLPGLIDVHVHMREPGGEHKETWVSGTRAALAGGITLLLAMPNTAPPTVDTLSFNYAEARASSSALVDYGLYLGGTVSNSAELQQLAPKAAALKLYLNETFNTLKLDSVADWIVHFEKFPKNRAIVCHAEGEALAAVLAVSQLTNRSVHIAHVSTEVSIKLIREAKKRGWPVTCEVCPHHLFLTSESQLGDGWKEVRPRLATPRDSKALWDNLEYIDCFASDHAPHTREEKQLEKLPGFPSVQYMLPLLLNAVSSGRLTIKQLIHRLYTNPKRIFGLPDQNNTYVEVDMNEEWTIPENGGHSKAQWTPYAGMKIKGSVRSVVIRGEEAYVDGEFIAVPGFGKNIRFRSDGTVLDQCAGQSREQKMAFQMVMEEIRTRGANGGTTLKPPCVNGVAAVSYEKHPVEHISRPLTPRENPFRGLHVINVESFTKDMVNMVLRLADYYKEAEDIHTFRTVLKGYQMAAVFYEVSTRTLSSFSSAMNYLGGKVICMHEQTSSVQKGERLEDSITIMSSYVDVVVLRHPQAGAASRAALVSRKPLINAGDGTGQHPTQALLDIFTIRAELGTVRNVTIAMVGDLRNGRTVHSLAKLLCVFSGVTLHYVSPNAELAMPAEVQEYVAKQGLVQKEFYDLESGIRDVDVVYMTRVQKERFSSEEEYVKAKGDFVLTQKLLIHVTHSKSTRGRGRQLPIVMHPLPRCDEISPDLNMNTERAVYFKQAANGLYVRMALLSLVLDRLPR